MSKHIRQQPEHQHEVIKEAARLLEEVPARRKSLVKLYNQAQLILPETMQRKNITTLFMIKWFEPDLQKYLKEQESKNAQVATIKTSPEIVRVNRLDRLVTVLEGIKGSLDKIAENTTSRKNVTLQKVSLPEYQQETARKPITPKDILVIGLLNSQRNHLVERIKGVTSKVNFIDPDKHKSGTFPKADYVILTDHVNHAVVDQCQKKYGTIKVVKMTTNVQSIAEKIKSLS